MAQKLWGIIATILEESFFAYITAAELKVDLESQHPWLKV
jgi:hypothetical protein